MRQGCLFLLIALSFQTVSCAAQKGGDIVKDPYDLCTNPLLELGSLDLVELRQYETSAQRWKAKTPELTERLSRYKLLLPETLIQRGLSNLGELTRLEAALQKLVKGEALTVVALGGSISAGHGVHDPGNGWVSRVFTWLQETFPSAKHNLLNRAIPATTSGYISACMPELVPEDTDLVIVEFTYNDYVLGEGSRTVNNPSRRGLERLLRRLIAHPSRPGILYVHYWPAARFDPPFMNDEELVDVVLKYYGIPTLSMKNAIHSLVSDTPQLLDQFWWPAPDNKIHPTCIGTRILADLVIGHLQRFIARLQDAPISKTDSRLEVLLDKQPFLLELNWGHTHTSCVLEDNFPSLVQRNKGWKWTDEGKTEKQHKWGFISHEPGHKLVIRVPLELLARHASNKHQFLVGIGGLISYQHMGSMLLQCSGGCSCPQLMHNMFHNQRFSMSGWRYLNVSRVSQSPCLVSITNNEQTSTGEHKLKVSALMVSTRGEVEEGKQSSMLSLAMTDTQASLLASARSLPGKPSEKADSSQGRFNRKGGLARSGRAGSRVR